MSEVVYTNTQQGRVSGIVRDLIRARELLIDLIWKDLRVRYRYALMGFVWAVLEPVAMMLILTFVFTVVFKAKTAIVQGEGDPPFAVMLLCGLVPWQFLASALTAGTRSLIDSQNLIKKGYFPREVVPLAAVSTGLVNLVIGCVVLLVVHVALGGTIGLGLVWFPVVFAIQFVLTVGLVLFLSCVNVYFRDVGYLVGVGIVFGFYATPVFYPLELVMEHAAAHPVLLQTYLLNPMAELNTAYREILFQNRFPDVMLLVRPCVAAVACLAVGLVTFRRHSPVLSDYL